MEKSDLRTKFQKKQLFKTMNVYNEWNHRKGVFDV